MSVLTTVRVGGISISVETEVVAGQRIPENLKVRLPIVNTTCSSNTFWITFVEMLMRLTAPAGRLEKKKVSLPEVGIGDEPLNTILLE